MKTLLTRAGGVKPLRVGAVLVGLMAAIACGSSRSSFAPDERRDGEGTLESDGTGFGTPGTGFGTSGGVDGSAAVVNKCRVPPDDTASNAPRCEKPPAPPNSFTPKSKWTWNAPPPPADSFEGSAITPLVANFTDDNGDGAIDLCDVPDVIVTTNAGHWEEPNSGIIYMLAGDTGQLEATFEGHVDGNVTPAIGDIDGDGKPEVVTVDMSGHIVIYDETGKIQTVSPDVGVWKQDPNSYCTAIAIYDLDADGAPEIIVGFEVFDNQGKRKFGHDISKFEDHYWCPANIAADLDGDGKLEVIFGNAAYHADGSLYWSIPGAPGQPQIANLDSDPEPEILIAREDGLLILEHDGQVKVGPYKPFNEPFRANCWSKPAAIHDFDGDGRADIAASACKNYGVIQVNTNVFSLSWSATVNDSSGIASSTAFDFLGRGIANAVYGDQVALYVFDGASGHLHFTESRASGTLIEYPVVADIDNDQSADILVVSNKIGEGYKHTIEAFEDAERRWIPTRRIWNQHAYHVTNVREDGTIPKVMAKSWTKLNTFRTNSQIEEGGDCAPPSPNLK